MPSVPGSLFYARLESSRTGPGFRASALARIVATILVVAAVMLAAPAARSQESITKAEELIRMQWIPLSRMATFAEQYPDEVMDFSAWMILRALDTSSAWNPRNRAWNLYRVNIRYDIEQVFRRRWQAAEGTIRSLAENPDTSLAKFYADALSVEQMEKMLEFYRTGTGRKYLQYLREIRRSYYRGSLELDRISIDPEYGSTGDTSSDRRRAWLSQKKISLDPPPPGYDFHIKAAQGIFSGADAMNLVFSLLAGAPPGGEAFNRLDQLIPSDSREEVSQFLNSPAFSNERQARRNWSEAIAKNKSALPLVVGNIAGMVEMLGNWKKTRVLPTALPLSVSQIDPDTLQIPAEYSLLKLEDDATPAALRSCMPKVSDASIRNLTSGRDGKSYREFTSVIRMPDAKNFIATRREFVACIPTTAPGYPIPAINSFLGTVRIAGMGDADDRRWRQNIAQEIGANGVSESLVIMENGSAFEISYAVNVRSPQQMVYLSRYFPAGTYDPGRYRTVMKSAGYKSMIVTSTTGSDGMPRREKSMISTPDDVRRFEERTKPASAPAGLSPDNAEQTKQARRAGHRRGGA